MGIWELCWELLVLGTIERLGPGSADSTPAPENHRGLRSGYTMRTKSQSWTRSSEIAFLRRLKIVRLIGKIHVLSHTGTVRKNAISDERVRDCALCTHSVFRPL